MGLERSQFNRIINIIDQRRLRNQQEHQARKDKVYKGLPRIHEIEVAISEKTMSLTREIILNPDRRDQITEELVSTVTQLVNEKKSLLKEHDLPENYLEPIFDCEDCKDTGYIDHQKCHCLKKEIIRYAYSQSNLDHVLSVENFDHFKLDYYSDVKESDQEKSPREIAERNYKVCYNFTVDFADKFENLILYGQAGLGKTFLCNCIAKELLDQGLSVIYLTAFNLFKLIENYRFHNEESGVSFDSIQAIYSCDLLIIDDLGTELNNTFTTSELFNILNARLLDENATVISTNLSPGQLASHYSDRIVSRMFGNYKMLNFIGSDIRLKKL